MNALDHNLHLGTRHASWPAALDGRFGRVTLGAVAVLAPGLRRRAVATLEVWARRSRDRGDLMRLDDRMLKDIGLNRIDVEAEWRKPFWRA